jgi:hypothetical protein
MNPKYLTTLGQGEGTLENREHFLRDQVLILCTITRTHLKNTFSAK